MSLADTVYWINTGDNMIRAAPLGGGGNVDTLYSSGQGVDYGLGIALDPAAGRIYWANYGDSTIRGASLAGGGTVDTLYGSAQGVTDPIKLAVDTAAGRLYWSGDYGNGTIRRAPVAGGGPVDTLYSPTQGVFAPTGVAIDPAAARIYWSDSAYGTIRGAPLAGSGTVNTLYGQAQGVVHPAGVAIDPAPGGPATILRGPLEGRLKWAPDWAQEVFSRFFPTRTAPGRIYWANADNTIRAAPLAGGGTVDTLYGSTQGVSSPSVLALLRAPLGTGAPAITWSLMLPEQTYGGLGYGGSHSGPLNQRLSCSRGLWASDLVGGFLYRAPDSYSYQWRLNGTDIAGATSANYTPTTPGSYTCRVTASNRAGSTSQMSAAVTTA